MNRLVCISCGKTYDLKEPRWACDCGGVLDIEFEARLDPAASASRSPSMWRYREAIPVMDDASIVTLGEGFTPLREFPIAGRRVLVKEEYLNPTGSFKDRGASVLISQVKQLGITEVVEDSSGNAGAAVAAYCGVAGVECTVYVPEGVRREKLERIKRHGAQIREVRGGRRDCEFEALAAARRTYYASHSHSPFFLQGTKTFAYEVCEQLEWESPDVLVLPVGNGTLLLGALIGFKDLLAAGITEGMPRLIGVQAKSCAPLYHAMHSGHEEKAREPDTRPVETMADGVAVTSPIRGGQVLEAVRETGGDFFAVDEHEIVAALRDVANKGFQIEPTAAVAIAGLARYLAREGGEDLVVTAFTGNNAAGLEY